MARPWWERPCPEEQPNVKAKKGFDPWSEAESITLPAATVLRVGSCSS